MTRASFAIASVLVATTLALSGLVSATPAWSLPHRPTCTTTSSGSCIRGGEFCPKSDYGMTGTDASGNTYVCTGDSSHPHWESTGDGSGDPGGDPGPPATASGTCRYAPALLKRIVVGSSDVSIRTALHYGGSAGSACTKNFLVSADLSHGDDTFSMLWSDSDRTDDQTVYPFEIRPGTYRLTSTDCQAYTQDYSQTYPCAVEPRTTVIKFAGHARLTAKRLSDGHQIHFAAVATRANSDYGISPITTKTSLQIAVGRGRWRTIHTATARGSNGWAFTYRHSKRASYRIVTTETASSFAGKSGTVRT